MNLIQTVNLNYGDYIIANWQQECEQIRQENERLTQSAPYSQEKWYLVKNLLWEDSKYIEDTELGLRVININEPPTVIGEEKIYEFKVCTSQRRQTYESRKYAVIYQGERDSHRKQVQLLELPPRPDVETLNSDYAIFEIREINPDFEIHYDLIIHGKKDGYWEFDWTSPKVKSLQTKEFKNNKYEEIPDEGLIAVPYTIYTEVWKKRDRFLYRVYPDKLEVWQMDDWQSDLWKPDGSRFYHPPVTVNDVGIGTWGNKGYF